MLDTALSYVRQIGADRIEAHTVALALRLREGLTAQGHRLFPAR